MGGDVMNKKYNLVRNEVLARVDRISVSFKQSKS